MEKYPEELRTPPVTLVCLVGYPELHQKISAFLHAEQPPMNTLALPDFSKLALLASREKEREGSATDPEAAAGILKREWLSKHRTKIPAVVAALFPVDRLEGDPAYWQQVCSDLDTAKTVLRGRNIKLLVVLVQTFTRDVNEDLITSLKRRAEIDSKRILVFIQKDVLERQSLDRIAGVFAELSNLYYREEGRRIKARIDKKNFSCIELNIRCCFKAAIYAEFRHDWAEALRFYEDGYRNLREMVGISRRLPPVQRLIEVKAVAEQFHFKISTLMLHGGKFGEAVTWFRKHLSCYEQLVGELEVAFLHWEWLSRQYLVFAELMETSSSSVPTTVSSRFGTSDSPLTEWEFQPAYYCQLSAQYLKQKRESLNYSLSLSDSFEQGSTDSIISSEFVGQFVRLIEEGDTPLKLPLVDAEYIRHALSEGKSFQDSFEIIALLRKSLEYFNKSKSTRMSSYCTNRIAKEHFVLSEFDNAKDLFDGLVELYREEGWVTLLWESLGYLRECSKKLNLPKDLIEYSLEMSALPLFCDGINVFHARELCSPVAVPNLFQRQLIQEDIFKLLKSETSPISCSDGSSNFNIKEDEFMCLEIDPISPLRPAFLAAVAFHRQSVKPGMPALFTLAILTCLPNPVEIDQLEIQFNQPECNFTVGNARKEGSIMETSANGTACKYYNGPREGIPLVLKLESNEWMRLTCEVKAEKSGKLECLSVVLKLGHHLSVCCRAESTASMQDLPLWKFEVRRLSFPVEDHTLSYSGQKFIQVEEPDPQVDFLLDASGPALVGEVFTVPVTVVSKGHEVYSGELKINIVDARGGGLMSPREAESFSFDNHHVELLSISSMADGESPKDVDNIKKVTQSFGLVSVPFLEVGGSWHGKVEIKWHIPKSVMLYVSLSYSPNGSESSPCKINVHKSLQIEGKIPITVNHRFLLPFRREPLLPPKVKEDLDASETRSLALNETSILVVSARNCCEVPLLFLSMSAEGENPDAASKCTISRVGGSSSEPTLLVPGVDFKQVFSVIPCVESPNVDLGCISIQWRRDSLGHKADSHVVTKQKLPDVRVERPPLIVSWECPPHAVVGVPFMVYVKLINLTSLLQDIKFSLLDSQSFVFCGCHSDSTSILPKSEHTIPYKLVPLCSGHQQLPLFSLTSVRYSSGFHPSLAASTIFVFPSEPSFNVNGDETSSGYTTAIFDVA